MRIMAMENAANMFERLKSFLGTLPKRSGNDTLTTSDPHVAAAALMIYVADADGLQGDEERVRMREILAGSYDLAGKELEKVLLAGEKANREAVDFFAFTSVLNRALDEDAKIEFIGILWELVYADGEMHELEDNMVWRIAELIGVSSRERILQRQRVRAKTGAGGE